MERRKKGGRNSPCCNNPSGLCTTLLFVVNTTIKPLSTCTCTLYMYISIYMYMYMHMHKVVHVHVHEYYTYIRKQALLHVINHSRRSNVVPALLQRTHMYMYTTHQSEQHAGHTCTCIPHINQSSMQDIHVHVYHTSIRVACRRAHMYMYTTHQSEQHAGHTCTCIPHINQSGMQEGTHVHVYHTSIRAACRTYCTCIPLGNSLHGRMQRESVDQFV